VIDLLVTLVTGQVGANLRRFARLAVFAALALTFLAIALAAGAVGLVLALDAALGPIRAALTVAGGAFVIAALVSIPIWIKPKPPPPSAAATLAQVALALGLGFLADRKARKDAPEP
jgi:hypothetical protein